jgi:predicted lactoylglutathione lyase
MKQKLHIIELAVADVGRSLSFYKNAFGWEVDRFFEEQSAAFFQLDTMYLLLYSKELLGGDMELEFANSGGASSGVVLVHVAKTEDEVEQIVDRAAEYGATILKYPSYAGWGGYRAFIQDPDCHVWQISHIPQFNFTQDNNIFFSSEKKSETSLREALSFFSRKE